MVVLPNNLYVTYVASDVNYKREKMAKADAKSAELTIAARSARRDIKWLEQEANKIKIKKGCQLLN